MPPRAAAKTPTPPITASVAARRCREASKDMPPVKATEPSAASRVPQSSISDRISEHPTEPADRAGRGEQDEQEGAAGERARDLLLAILGRQLGAEPLVDRLELL